MVGGDSLCEPFSLYGGMNHQVPKSVDDVIPDRQASSPGELHNWRDGRSGLGSQIGTKVTVIVSSDLVEVVLS